MAQNIIKEVQNIEAEADRILSGAKDKVRQRENSVEPELEKYRAQQQEKLKAKIGSLKKKINEETEQKIRELDENAKKSMESLENIDIQPSDASVKLIVERIAGDVTE